MVTFSVAQQQAQGVVEEMNFIGGYLRGILDDLQTTLQSSLATWAGNAQAAFASVQQDWNTKAADMQVQLANAENALGGILDVYRQADAAGQALWT